ncbi:MAG: hypothetical protein AAB526_00575 [Patescibacteria group bacterium]
MFSKIFREKYYPEIQGILEEKAVTTEQQVIDILQKRDLKLKDIYFLIQTYDNPKLRELIIKTASEKREKQWHNKLFLVPPLYVTDRCVNDCLYCPWRRSNIIQRRSLSEKQLESEIDFLIKQGYRTIELVGASDPTFTSEKTAKFISIVKQKLNEIGGGEV